MESGCMSARGEAEADDRWAGAWRQTTSAGGRRQLVPTSTRSPSGAHLPRRWRHHRDWQSPLSAIQWRDTRKRLVPFIRNPAIGCLRLPLSCTLYQRYADISYWYSRTVVDDQVIKIAFQFIVVRIHVNIRHVSLIRMVRQQLYVL